MTIIWMCLVERLQTHLLWVITLLYDPSFRYQRLMLWTEQQRIDLADIIQCSRKLGIENSFSRLPSIYAISPCVTG